MAHLPGLHGLGRSERHERELPLITATCCRFLGVERLPDSATIRWEDDGRSVLDGAAACISVSHDGDLCICVVGSEQQGCDLASIHETDRDGWAGLLGERRTALLDQLLPQDVLNRAGTRIWAAVEALRKATGSAAFSLDIHAQSRESVIFRCSVEGKSLNVLTVPVRLTYEREYIVAASTQDDAIPEELLRMFASEALGLQGARVGPDGRWTITERFPLTFREVSGPSRSLYFTQYFKWMGGLREKACQPVNDALTEQLLTGKWGMVTNSTQTDVIDLRKCQRPDRRTAVAGEHLRAHQFDAGSAL